VRNRKREKRKGGKCVEKRREGKIRGKVNLKG
jgi:hypothetical protein